MNKGLAATAVRYGDRASIFPISLLSTIETDISELKASDHFGDAAKAAQNFYNFKLPQTDFLIRSLVLIAEAKPNVYLNFCLNGREVSVFSPNSYQNVRAPLEFPNHYLQEYFCENGYRLQEWGWGVPLKMLAVRSGFAKYGRNNLAYVDGLGSCHTLAVFVSDYECGNTNVHALEQMEQCASCDKCLHACPTQAITIDRKQIIAERCLTYLNEFLDDIPNIREFPEWLDSTVHHGTHGCIRCQQVCPANQGVFHTITPVRFDEAETIMILGGITENELPEETRRKLEMVGELEYLPILPRNLGIIFSHFLTPN